MRKIKEGTARSRGLGFSLPPPRLLDGEDGGRHVEVDVGICASYMQPGVDLYEIITCVTQTNEDGRFEYTAV